MKTIYNTTVTDMGKFFSAFYEEKLIIIFKDNAPEDLADYCVLHAGNICTDTVKNGDFLVVADQTYKILYVGDQVQTNLQNLGHITLRFDGNTEGLDGSLYLEDKALPKIKIGDTISIYRK